MSEIVKGPPASARETLVDELVPLVEVAKAEPGEWFSIAMAQGLTQSGAQNAAQAAIVRLFAEYSTRGGRIWIRIKP